MDLLTCRPVKTEDDLSVIEQVCSMIFILQQFWQCDKVVLIQSGSNQSSCYLEVKGYLPDWV